MHAYVKVYKLLKDKSAEELEAIAKSINVKPKKLSKLTLTSILTEKLAPQSCLEPTKAELKLISRIKATAKRVADAA